MCEKERGRLKLRSCPPHWPNVRETTLSLWLEVRGSDNSRGESWEGKNLVYVIVWPWSCRGWGHWTVLVSEVMQSGPRVWLEEKTGGGRRTEPQLPSLSFSITSMPLWPLVAGGRARWTYLHPGHRECLTCLRFYMANRAHPSTSSPSITTGMKRDTYKKEQIHSSISWPASLRKSRWEGRTENLIRAQSVLPSMDKGRPSCQAPRKLAQRQRSQDRAGRMGFLRAKDNEWMPLVARNTKVGAQGRGQKPPAQTPYCLREHDLLPWDSSPGRWIDCSLQKRAEGSISSSLILLLHLKVPPHCFHQSGTAVLYSLHDPSQALHWHTCFRDF